MAKTVVTNNGLAAAALAGVGGALINITSYKIGGTLIVPDPTMTDVTGQVYAGTVSDLTYQVVNSNFMLYKLSLSEIVGNFNVGNIGLYLADGTLFSLTGMTGIFPKEKQAGSVVGNRLTVTIIIGLSNIAAITNVSIIVQDASALPVVANQGQLPSPSTAPYPVYEVIQGPNFGTPTLALRNGNTWTFLTADTTVIAIQQALTTADTVLQTNITNEAAARTAAIAATQVNLQAEITARTTADNLLQTHINTEAATRSAADTTLQNNINTVNTALTAESTARIAAVTTIQTALNALPASYVHMGGGIGQTAGHTVILGYDAVNNVLRCQIDSTDFGGLVNIAALNVEINTRSAAVTNLQNSINGVALNLSNETNARVAADSSLQSQINIEIGNRQTVDASLQSQINTVIAGFTGSNSSPGYKHIYGGIILQWGLANSSGATGIVVVFPVAFPNAMLGASASNGSDQPPAVFQGIGPRSNTNMAVWGSTSSGIGALNFACWWTAIGF